MERVFKIIEGFLSKEEQYLNVVIKCRSAKSIVIAFLLQELLLAPATACH